MPRNKGILDPPGIKGVEANQMNLLRRHFSKRYQKLADHARDTGNWPLATKCYRKAVKANPHNVALWVQLGHSLKEQGQWDDAERAYHEAVSLDPLDVDAQLQCGRILALKGRFDEARQSIELALQQIAASDSGAKYASEEADLHAAMGDIGRDTKNWTLSLQSYRKAVVASKKPGPIWVQLGHALKEFGDIEAAEHAYRQGLALSSSDKDRDDVRAHLLHVLTEIVNRHRNSVRAATAEKEKILREKQQTVTELERRQRELEASLHAMEHSLSWRLTKPVRLISRVMGGTTGSHPAVGMLGKLGASSLSKPAQNILIPTKLDQMRSATRQDMLSSMKSAADSGRPIYALLPTISWDVPLFQRPQHIAVAASRQGVFTIYMTHQNLGAECRIVNENCWVVQVDTNLNDKLIDDLQGAIVSAYSTAPYNRPASLAHLRKKNRVIYEYIDHVDEAISGKYVDDLLKLKKFAFSGGVDLVVASATALREEAERHVGKSRVALVPNGADYQHYQSALQKNNAEPADMRSFRERHRAIIGYFGALAPWIWHEMINELTARRLDLGFVLIGPDYHGGMSRIERRDNVLVTGAMPYERLPDYAKSFDATMIPFRHGEIARTTSPLKLFEYFSLEKPVVVTDQMAECTIYPEVFRAGEASGFSSQLDKAVQKSRSRRFRSRLRKLALENTWDVRARTLVDAGQNVRK